MTIGLFDRRLNRDLVPATQPQIRSEIGVFGLGASLQIQSGSSNASPTATQAAEQRLPARIPKMDPEKPAIPRGVGG